MGIHKALAAAAVMLVLILSGPVPVRSQTVDEMVNPGEAYRKCYETYSVMNAIRRDFKELGCPDVLRNGRDEYYKLDQQAKDSMQKLDQANNVARQWQERYNTATAAYERAEAECRSSYISSSAACQIRDNHKRERDEAASNQRRAEEIGKRFNEEYRSYVERRDIWARSYQACSAIQKSPDYVSEEVLEDQARKCRTLYTLMQQFPTGTPGDPTTRQSQTPTTTPPGKPQAPTARTVKIGYVNYQKLSGFTVSINGTSKSCSSGFDMSRPHAKGDGDCTFEVPAGPCSISVSASGYRSLSFQHTCDKDETMMTTLSKAQ